MVDEPSPGIPQRLGRYAVRKRLGIGGFATVWLAYDEHLDSPVAIKVLADNWSADHQVRTRFVEEGRYLRRVESPHVVTVYDAGELDDGRPYLVMTYADEGTLADRLERGPLTVTQAREVVTEVAAGLQALHDRDILHRDIKPANVLFRSVGCTDGEPRLRAMVGDLGLGKALDISSRLTMIAGTPSFVSPEQAQGERLDARADQYSLGVLAYLLLAGRTPYSHASLSAAAEPGPPPGLGDGEFPAEVDAVVRRALARDSADRWPSVTAFSDALAEALDGHAATDRPPGWTPLDPGRTEVGAGPSPTTAPMAAEADPPLVEERANGADPPLVEERANGADPPLVEERAKRASRDHPAVVAAAAVALLAIAGVGGYLLYGVGTGTETVTDVDGSLSVTVPDGWTRARADDGWTPPGVTTTFAALSIGTAPDWTDPDVSGEGVFLGVMPMADDFPEVPAHPECNGDPDVTERRPSGRRSITAIYDDCPVGVVVERVEQIARERVLWVQIRSDDRATANQVLDSVDTHGI